MRTCLSIFFFASALSQSVLAHPGHETLPVSGESATHYFFEPQHGYVYGIAILAAAAISYVMIRRFNRI